MATALDKLKEFTTVVADTGDFQQLVKYKPQDSTTNPSLIFAASGMPAYSKLVDDAVEYGKKHGSTIDEQVDSAIDKACVNFGIEILKIVPGRVSTEVNAALSFDTEGTIKKAHRLIKLYEEAGINKERVLIKIASTWEGIEAARQLEKEGIHCNLTLLFSMTQAAACAEAGVTLISPFAGRITDFFKIKDKVEGYAPASDPGVLSVKKIFNYYKTNGYKTVVMGASFRTKEQVIELAGCDLLTISPKLLEELAHTPADAVTKKLDKAHPESSPSKIVLDQQQFSFELCTDEMAYMKTGEGIRNFVADLRKLADELKKRIQA